MLKITSSFNFKCNLFSILFKYILINGLLVFPLCFFKIYSKESWIANPEYDPSFNSSLSFHVRDDILDLLLLCEVFMFFYVLILRFDKAILFSTLHKSNLSVRLSNIWFRIFTIFRVHKYSIPFCICIDLIMLLHTFLNIIFLLIDTKNK